MSQGWSRTDPVWSNRLRFASRGVASGEAGTARRGGETLFCLSSLIVNQCVIQPRVSERYASEESAAVRMSSMKCRDLQISFDAVIERIAPEVPRYVVYPGEAWDETGTFIVQVALNGIPIGLRNLIPWKERGWHFGLSEPICRKVGVETGDRVRVEMRRLGDIRPRELQDLLKNDRKARKTWDVLSDGERCDFVLFVADAKKPETRIRRARRLLDIDASRVKES